MRAAVTLGTGPTEEGLITLEQSPARSTEIWPFLRGTWLKRIIAAAAIAGVLGLLMGKVRVGDTDIGSGAVAVDRLRGGDVQSSELQRLSEEFIQVALSDPLLAAAGDELGMNAAEVKASLTLSRRGNTGLVGIDFRASSPEVAANGVEVVARLVATHLLTESLEAATTEATALQVQYEAALETLHGIEFQAGRVDIANEYQRLVQDVRDLEADVASATDPSQRAALRSLLDQRRTERDALLGFVTSWTNQNDQVQQVQQQLTAATTEVTELQTSLDGLAARDLVELASVEKTSTLIAVVRTALAAGALAGGAVFSWALISRRQQSQVRHPAVSRPGRKGRIHSRRIHSRRIHSRRSASRRCSRDRHRGDRYLRGPVPSAWPPQGAPPGGRPMPPNVAPGPSGAHSGRPPVEWS